MLTIDKIIEHLKSAYELTKCYPKPHFPHTIEHEELKLLLDRFDFLNERIEYLERFLEVTQEEGRAAVKDLKELRRKSGWKCFACMYDEPDNQVRSICVGCGYNDGNNWAWRGLKQKKEK